MPPHRNKSQVFHKANKICLYAYTLNNTHKKAQRSKQAKISNGEIGVKNIILSIVFRNRFEKLCATDFSFLHSFSNMFLKTMLSIIFFTELAHFSASLIFKMIQCSSTNVKLCKVCVSKDSQSI